MNAPGNDAVRSTQTPADVRTAGFVVRGANAQRWRALTRRGTLALARAFIRGEIEVDGDMVAAVRWWREHHPEPRGGLITLRAGLRLERWLQTRSRARRNIAFHYDRSNAFYQQFLDSRMVYSSAYFERPSMSLDEAQQAKLRLILRELDVQPGHRLLDIGCGWGALMLEAASVAGTTVVGCTVSREQYAYVDNLIRERGLQRRVSVMYRDWRDVRGEFDRIASIGMYEHVGGRRLGRYFRTLSRLLMPGGLLLNSGIARPETTADDAMTLFVQRAVFPGGDLPTLATVVRHAGRAGLTVRGLANLREHYGHTCAEWTRRLRARRAACLSIVSEETYRTWLLYLAGSAVSFERGELDVHHIVLSRPAERRIQIDEQKVAA
jgi:cyclopropane-fatty-acyl-phospholipid synthase